MLLLNRSILPYNYATILTKTVNMNFNFGFINHSANKNLPIAASLSSSLVPLTGKTMLANNAWTQKVGAKAILLDDAFYRAPNFVRNLLLGSKSPKLTKLAKIYEKITKCLPQVDKIPSKITAIPVFTNKKHTLGKFDAKASFQARSTASYVFFREESEHKADN